MLETKMRFSDAKCWSAELQLSTQHSYWRLQHSAFKNNIAELSFQHSAFKKKMPSWTSKTSAFEKNSAELNLQHLQHFHSAQLRSTPRFEHPQKYYFRLKLIGFLVFTKMNWKILNKPKSCNFNVKKIILNFEGT